jgi:hypothetical protein
MPDVIDKYHGEGGSYTRDPVTGVRTLVERTDFAPEGADKAAPTAPTAPTPADAANGQG